MTSARCHICNDIITPGVSMKLYQTLICPTCLGRLRVASLNPFELEPMERQAFSIKTSNHSGNKKSASKKYSISDDLDDEYDDLDDYTIERRLRYKSERERRRKSSFQSDKSAH